jgi:23S rRNA (guanine745-N1)-methyltransferase
MTLICPLCKNILQESSISYTCTNKHNFDKSKDGYVNLLLSNKKEQGDDTMMLQARKRFLERGYYEAVIEAIARRIEEQYSNIGLTILDLGCGEGRYLHRLQEKRADRDDSFFALDIAKQAAKMTAKQTQ